MEQHQRVFKIASVVLQHPEKEWTQTDELKEEVAQIENKLINMLLKQFLHYSHSVSHFELCETYTRTFDFSEKTTLYLTYPIFTETPDRGKGLLKLKQEYYDAGFPLESDELPDYLPLILEFCSFAPMKAVQKMMLINRKSIDQLLKELTIIDSPYQFVVQACIEVMANIFSKRQAS